MREINDKLDEILARAEAAMVGPWSEDVIYGGLRHLDRNCSEWYYDYLKKGFNAPGSKRMEDAAFIAAARTDVPALVKALHRALKTAYFMPEMAYRSIIEHESNIDNLPNELQAELDNCSDDIATILNAAPAQTTGE